MNREHALRVYNFQEIRRVVPLAAILKRYGVLSELRKIGNQHFGTCPIHQGSNRKQFVCDLQKNAWHCFGDCDRGGGTVEFVCEMEGRIPIFRAAALIAEWFAVRTEQQAATRERRKPMSENSHRRPTHKVFTVRGEGDDAWWTRLGSAWPTKDGRGLNVVLDGLPVDGRLVLREYTDEDVKRDDEVKHKSKFRR
jgi:hypothetical protein